MPPRSGGTSREEASKPLWAQIKQLMATSGKSKWNTVKALPTLLNEDGIPATSQKEVADIQLRHFAKGGRGTIVDPNGLTCRYNSCRFKLCNSPAYRTRV